MNLHEPLTLGRGVRAPSRVMFGPHETNLGRRRAFTDRHVAYYRRRAAGGAGIVVTETASVHPSDWPYERAPLAAESAAGWASIARACHAEGALALASIGHAGGQGSSAYSQQPLLAPSRVPEVNTREVPKAMEAEDIAAVVEGFGDAARRAVSAGLDGVEVNAGQHSLVRQFLSGLTNQRQDGYGEDRQRFAREVLESARAAAGDALVGLRLSCDELAPWAGITPDSALDILAVLHPYADYVVVVRGSIYSVSATRPDGHTRPGFNLGLTRRVRDALPGPVTVVAQGSIVEVAMADDALRSGAADAVEMTRAQIADPDLVRKVRAGAAATVRPCVLCNQTCQVRDPRNPVVSCVGEPSSGHETEDAAESGLVDGPVGSMASRPQRVLVVGAGPAGLESARVAALHGHRVRVVDRARRPGGAVRAAASGAGRERLDGLADWLAGECARLGVEVELGREIAAADIDAHEGAVLICTGSRDGRRDYRVEAGADIRTARSVLEAARTGSDGALPHGPVVIWDPIGGPIGISVAELLAPGGQVALVTHDLIAGTQLARSGDLADASTRLQRAGVALHKRSRLVAVTSEAAVVEDVFTGDVREIEAALVIDAGHRLPEDALWRAHPGLILAQINHNGGQASGMYSRLPVWAASPVADPMFREVAKEVDHAEIAEIVAGYAATAGHCVQGGFDGIELQCSHSSIVRGFLSPATNLRDDEYGGDLRHRARLLLEIVAAVRAAIGPRRALGVRLCGDELIDGGTTIDDAVEVARMVEATGQVDYINTSIGVATATLYMIEASMHIPPGYALFIPSALRKAVELPVVGVGRFKDPLQAERALAEGHCDLIGVVRGQIADADFAAKARSGHADDIRLCLSCNQECVGRMGLNRWLGCIENPRTGRESARVVPSARVRRRVMVAGAGPAGLQAAITAAGRGHEVTVHERGDAPGGQVRLAATVPSRAEFGDLIRNQLAECARLGVAVSYGSEVDVAAVRAAAPDAVVVATGAVAERPYWAPGDTAQVVDVRQVLDGSAAPAGRVLVVDEIGFHHATSVAELLADRGARVEVVTPGMVVGQDLGITLDMENWCVRAAAKGIVQTTDCLVTAVEPGSVTLLHHPTGRSRQVDADWVVCAVPAAPAEQLYLDLKALGRFEVHRAGDCVAPRRAHAAVIEGQRAGEAL